MFDNLPVCTEEFGIDVDKEPLFTGPVCYNFRYYTADRVWREGQLIIYSSNQIEVIGVKNYAIRDRLIQSFKLCFNKGD